MNFKKITLYILLAIPSLCLQAQSPDAKAEDIKSIKAMCGCHQVTFDYFEQTPVKEGYELHEPYHTGASAEWVFVAEEDEDNIVLQHILVVQDSIIIKHWRQDWLYENRDQLVYQEGANWKHAQLSPETVSGKWTQKVYQVDDSPRYEGTAVWTHIGELHYWESNTDAPLPRREYTKRSDYNVMNRTNRQALTQDGWYHEQDNQKILRSEAGDEVLVTEKGLNYYKKIDESNCQAAIDWWKDHHKYWAVVRSAWTEALASSETVSLSLELEGTKMWQKFFDLGENVYAGEVAGKKNIRSEVEAIIAAHSQANADAVNTY